MSNIVKIKLSDGNIYDITTRVEEVHTIREWVCELVEWDDTKFEIKYLGSSDSLSIWFDDERHAMLCALRWQ